VGSVSTVRCSAGLALAPRSGIPRRAIADAAAPALLIAQVIGRIGNYLNQELFGKPTDAWWGLEVDARYRPDAYLSSTTFQPTFLIEALANLVLFALFWTLLRRWTHRTPGILFPLYIAAYSFVRILVEPLRIDAANEWMGVRQNVWVSGVLIVGALLAALYMHRRYRRLHGSPVATN